MFPFHARSALLGIGLSPLALACAPPDSPASATPSTATSLCEEGTPAYDDATRMLARVAEQIESMQNAHDVAVARAQLEALLASQCFEQSMEVTRSLETTSALALRTWWSSGGESWVRSYLDRADSASSSIVIPPEVRSSLAYEDHRSDSPPHPLAILMCRPDEADCGASTRGWRERSEMVFARASDASEDPCSAQHAYGDWRDCIEEHRPIVPALPLGELRAPDRGSLVITQNGGSRCERVATYDLETGAADVQEHCGHEHARRGHVHLANLREALWMMLLANEIEDVQIEAAFYALPEGMKVEPHIGSISMSGTGGGASHSTHVSWIWRDRDRVLGDGQFEIPAFKPGIRYAADLMRIMELGFEER